ncbi:hypothetical protein EST38_g8388 [Candolleomyces aberdarensis]|uniref:mitogen-activated protein kinase kinase n=1 Tax=Candolleomyces aberdarensis TaxID=2316362 RepID=A0A4Q2DFH5_9AGAR|nr:hypothetical protein EST38_g8388 [Candolleomyces aberdarensis]
MLAEITEGLAYLHSRQILHGDVRGVSEPLAAPIRMSPIDVYCLQTITEARYLPYPPINPPWSPPEFSSYEKPPMLTKQSDIWSLGITFLELLVDELPFREMAHGVWHAYKGTVSERPKSLAAIQSRISNEMRSLLERCWEKPESRDRIEDVQDALNLIRERPTAIYNEEALVVPTFIESIPEDTVRLDPSRPPKLQLELDHKYSSRHVYVGSSDAVVAGTLGGLIDRLVDNIDLRKDNILREAILMASVDFASPKDVAAKMWEQFNEAEQDKQQRSEARMATQYNVLKVMSYWLRRRQLPVDAELLWEMREFCMATLKMKSSPTLVEKIHNLLELIEIRLEGLVKLCSADGNHSRYREALKEVIDPTYRDYCIPWIDVHLEELRSILRANGRIVEIKGQPLINIQRYTEFLNRVKELFSLPPPDLERYRHQGQLAYLEAQLADVQIGEVADRELEEKAQSLKAIEDVLISQRVIGLIRCGHRIPQELRRYVFVTG